MVVLFFYISHIQRQHRKRREPTDEKMINSSLISATWNRFNDEYFLSEREQEKEKEIK